MKTLYLVTKKHSWQSIEIDGIQGNKAPNGSIGFALWFDDYDTALAWADGDAAIVIRGTETHSTEQEKLP